MSDDNLGKFTFLPWLRRGISTQISQTDGTAVNGRAAVQVTVLITDGTQAPSESSQQPVTVSIALLGPGDVKAFDTRAITRTWPKENVFEVEPNYFPLIELFPADIAWRYTPAKADAQDRLRPWLGLIVLRDDEIDSISSPTSAQPLATVTTKAGPWLLPFMDESRFEFRAPLPRVDQLWAWAHVHIDGAGGVDVTVMQGLLDSAAHQVVARLVCPRRLDQRTAYTAFLVPTLEATRQSALGQPLDPNLDVSQPAWKNDGTAVTLPVFYHWRFQTSDTGDFESLARRIAPQSLPATVGQRAMDVSNPGLQRVAAASQPLAVESALKPLDAQPSPWDATERQAWTSSLSDLVNLPALRLQQQGLDATLAPPLYGRWYAAAPMLATTAPPWFQDLNADPRTRVAAAIGWQVVQNEQQQLLAGAWAQVDAVRAANLQLRQAQLAREAALRLYTRHMLPLAQQQLTLFTQPLHTRVLIPVSSQPKPITVRSLVQKSPLRVGVLSAPFVKLSRPLGPVGVRQGRPFGTTPSTLVDRVNTGTLPIAPPPPTPVAIVTPSNAGVQVLPPWVTPELIAWLKLVPIAQWSNIPTLVTQVNAAFPNLNAPGRSLQLWLQEIGADVTVLGGTPSDNLDRRIGLTGGTLTPTQLQTAPTRPGFVARPLNPDGTLPPLTASTGPEDPRFRLALATAFGNINVAPAAGETLYPIDLGRVTTTLLGALDPSKTIGATFGGGRIGILSPWNPPDPLDPVMAAPSFPQPMYKPLYDLSPDWILPGFGQLPQDMASLAHPNERFIEAYMTGLNDELGRTLLFNEYPTDQRGTYFRQFWDVNGVQNPGPDINPIAAWPKTSQLGGNSARPGVDTYLVLIIRAELLRRYPNTIVYAVQAQWNSDGTRSIATSPVELHPDFQGALGSGAGFWAFKLTTADARGSESTSGPAGWYFALQEHSSEPRFGLEPAAAAFATSPTKWQQLAWSDLATDANALAQLQYVDLGAALPNVGAVSDPSSAKWHVDGARASDLAYITYREPARLLVHASRMIPSDA